MWPPEMRLVLPSEETNPEPKTQLGNHARWIEELPLLLQGLFGARDLVSLSVPQPDMSIVVPVRTEWRGESACK
jgi:hypothetical protein